MSRAIHFIAKNVSGYGPPDAGCVPCSRVSGVAVSASPSSARADHRHCQTLKILTLKCSSRSTSYVSSASSSGHRRNPDFSRQNRQGFSRSRNRQFGERDDFENFEDSEVFTSKNGPVLNGSGSSRFQATAAPGPREKEIVELFRKVQAQLRERAAMKEEKESEEARGKGKDSETVDSLLKLLRKHSVQQGKKSSTGVSNRDIMLDQPETKSPPSENKSSNIFLLNSSVKQDRQVDEIPVTNRPRSVFQRRSPIRQVRAEPVQADLEVENSALHTAVDGKRSLNTDPDRIPELDLESESEIESATEQIFSDEGVFGEMSDDETPETYESDKDEVAEVYNSGKDKKPENEQVEASDLSEMKLTELRALAKSRGLKGFSKLKKLELIELLAGA